MGEAGMHAAEDMWETFVLPFNFSVNLKCKATQTT